MRDDESNLFISDVHTESARAAILDDNGECGWLYLTNAGRSTIAADVWVYNRMAAPEPHEIQKWSGDRPPPASTNVVDGEARYHAPHGFRWAIEWHRGGDALVLLRNGEPWAALSAAQKRGISRHLIMASGWGEPWSAEWFDKWVADAPPPIRWP